MPRFSSRHPRVERLEDRCVLNTGGISVGDADFVLYDDGVFGTAEVSFARDVATVDGLGQPVGVDERRYAETVGYAPVLEWTPTGVVTASTGAVTILGSGWDHDGQTPLMVVRASSSNQLRFYRGEDFSLVNVVPFGDGIPVDGVTGVDYFPRAVIVHHGLIVIAAERREDTGDGVEPVGVSFLVTQDDGASFQRVAQVGGGFDVPPLPDGVSEGIARSRQWSFANPFPVDGVDDRLGVWFPWADYLVRSGSPKGGQIGLFKATRPDEQSPWQVHANRLVHQEWNVEDPGGYHSHAAAVTAGGVLSHWGDVGYRNQVKFHEFDLDSYETAPIETTIAFGGYDPTATDYREAPQPVATAPAPTPGEHFASADLGQEVVLQFGSLSTASEPFDIDGAVTQPFRVAGGGVYNGPDILHLHWLQGVGYISGAVEAQLFHFSPDGENWAELTRPDGGGSGGRWMLYGNRLVDIRSGGELYVADVPEIDVVSPLQLAPGGQNRAGADLPIRLPADADVSRRRVEFSDGAWRYTDNTQALDVQPSAAPFGPDVAVYEIASAGLATNFGSWWLQPEGQTQSAGVAQQLDLWVANLGDQSVELRASLTAPDLPGAPTVTGAAYESAETLDWEPLGWRAAVPTSGESRFAVDLSSVRPSSGERFLVAIRGFGDSDTATYPIAPQQAGSDEVESHDGLALSDAWTVGLVFQWPANSPQTGTTRMPIASLTGDAPGDYVEVSIRHNSTTFGELTVDYFLGDQLALRQRHQGNFLRGDIVELVVSSDATEVVSTSRISGQPPRVSMDRLAYSPPLNEFAWRSADGGTVTTVNPILTVIDDNTAATVDQHEQWMHATLAEKAVLFAQAIPGDYNSDGLVNGVDYAIWREAYEPPDPALDISGDGQVGPEEYAAWRESYGDAGPGLPADFNGDGIVNAIDYAVIRDDGPKAVASGSGPDGNRDGIVDVSDLAVWNAAFGAVDATIGELLANPQPRPVAAPATEAPATEAPVAGASKTEASSALLTPSATQTQSEQPRYPELTGTHTGAPSNDLALLLLNLVTRQSSNEEVAIDGVRTKDSRLGSATDVPLGHGPESDPLGSGL